MNKILRVKNKKRPGIKRDFSNKVLKVVVGIKSGHVLTYKQVAQIAGSPRAYRAVGNILNRNYDPKIPCHRVVRQDGKIGGYNRGIEEKVRLLKKEKSILL
jgi:O-6-methylguanine DNA methyltransferase